MGILVEFKIDEFRWLETRFAYLVCFRKGLECSVCVDFLGLGPSIQDWLARPELHRGMSPNSSHEGPQPQGR